MLFVMLTETWLRNHLDAELHIKNYSIYRSDRTRPKKKRGRCSGGAAIYIRDDIAASADILLKYSNGVVELLCLYIKSENLVLCVIYRQPNDEKGGNPSTASEFTEPLQKLSTIFDDLPTPCPDIIFAGDFNLPKTSWPDGLPEKGCSPDERALLSLLTSFTEKHFLTQHILEPTHEAGNTLDLIFTNNPAIINTYHTTPTKPVSPHYWIDVSTPLSSSIKPSDTSNIKPESIFDEINLFSDDTDWSSIEHTLGNYDWSQEFQGLSVAERTEKFIKLSAQVCKDNAPEKPRYSGKKLSTIPRHRRVLMRRRTKLTRKYNSELNPLYKQKYSDELRDIELSLQESYNSQTAYDEEKAVNAIKKNSKYFFSYAQKRNKLRPAIGPLMDIDGDYITNPRKLANMFSAQYKSVFSMPCQFPLHLGKELPQHIQDIIFNESDIIHAIEELSPNSAPGPDKFPAILLLKCKKVLATPLHLIWRKSLDTGEIDPLLKWSYISPIHKGGKRDTAKNYRPVALTSHLIKVFEKVLRNALVAYIDEYSLFNPNQHGFRAGHSCLSQLLSHYDRITKLLEEGYNVDVVYLDFSKAFDKLDFNITIQKLYDMGISGKILNWITTFLTNRNQTVVVDGAKSTPELVQSGVPQGSVIGPLLFLIMLGDIDQGVASAYVSSFADDTRVLGKVVNNQDVENLQSDLDTIYQWSNANNALFNSDKFECLRYGPNVEIKHSTHYVSDLGTEIEQKDNVKDLGITMSADATFNTHIHKSAQSANQVCGWIFRTFSTRARTPMLLLWKSLVQATLDYCCQLWSPNTPGQIQMLEMVARNFIRQIKGLRHLSYWQQLAHLHMYSQQRRRERYMIIYIWKILEGHVPNFGISINYHIRRGRLCVIPTVKQSAPARIKTIRYASFAIKGPQLFNTMPEHIRNMKGCSTLEFKKALDSFLENVPDEPRIPGHQKFCRADSNSLVDMIAAYRQGLPRAEEYLVDEHVGL